MRPRYRRADAKRYTAMNMYETMIWSAVCSVALTLSASTVSCYVCLTNLANRPEHWAEDSHECSLNIPSGKSVCSSHISPQHRWSHTYREHVRSFRQTPNVRSIRQKCGSCGNFRESSKKRSAEFSRECWVE